ncbi:MAG: FISUMP domain-containing protein, partial [Bacteroidota bacterium]
TGEGCTRSNFYSYQELENVCPEGWRLPTTEDWDVLITTFDPSKKVKMLEKNKKFYRVDFLDRYDVFKNNTLGLKPIGRTQGNVRKYGDYADYWTINTQLNDPRFHIHVSPYTIVGHVHKHNVNQRNETKNRKFAVRCVCERKQ